MCQILLSKHILKNAIPILTVTTTTIKRNHGILLVCHDKLGFLRVLNFAVINITLCSDRLSNRRKSMNKDIDSGIIKMMNKLYSFLLMELFNPLLSWVN